MNITEPMSQHQWYNGNRGNLEGDPQGALRI